MNNDIKKIKNKFLENNFFRPKWYSIFFNPYFIVRYPLFKNIEKFSKTINGEKRILDVGCGLQPYKYLFHKNTYIGIDIQGGGHTDDAKNVDKFFDGENIPFEDGSFDIIICTEVLEHSNNPEKLISECYRVIKNGGQVYFSIPFVYNEHEAPYDFARYTQYGIKKLLSKQGFVVEKITPTTGVFGVCGQLISSFIFENTIKGTFIKSILSILILAPIQTFSIFLDWITRNKWITLNYIVIAKK